MLQLAGPAAASRGVRREDFEVVDEVVVQCEGGGEDGEVTCVVFDSGSVVESDPVAVGQFERDGERLVGCAPSPGVVAPRAKVAADVRRVPIVRIA